MEAAKLEVLDAIQVTIILQDILKTENKKKMYKVLSLKNLYTVLQDRGEKSKNIFKRWMLKPAHMAIFDL